MVVSKQDTSVFLRDNSGSTEWEIISSLAKGTKEVKVNKQKVISNESTSWG